MENWSIHEEFLCSLHALTYLAVISVCKTYPKNRSDRWWCELWFRIGWACITIVQNVVIIISLVVFLDCWVDTNSSTECSWVHRDLFAIFLLVASSWRRTECSLTCTIIYLAYYLTHCSVYTKNCTECRWGMILFTKLHSGLLSINEKVYKMLNNLL